MNENSPLPPSDDDASPVAPKPTRVRRSAAPKLDAPEQSVSAVLAPTLDADAPAVTPRRRRSKAEMAAAQDAAEAAQLLPRNAAPTHETVFRQPATMAPVAPPPNQVSIPHDTSAPDIAPSGSAESAQSADMSPAAAPGHATASSRRRRQPPRAAAQPARPQTARSWRRRRGGRRCTRARRRAAFAGGRRPGRRAVCPGPVGRV